MKPHMGDQYSWLILTNDREKLLTAGLRKYCSLLGSFLASAVCFMAPKSLLPLE